MTGILLSLRSRRLIARIVSIAGAIAASGIVAASGEVRVISFYHIHTNETLTVLYKKDGRYVPEAMEKINWIMRDWRKNEQTAMDPATIDLLWEMHAELGSQEPINIICGYRSRETNEMLRRTVGGQAQQSQHITGKAVDVTFPDVPLKQIRYSALIHERGGVGYYPTSGIPFVHVDSGRVRAWPRLPRDELALLFPNGRTQHMPSDGGPISLDDVRKARAQKQDLATEIASFLDFRRQPKPQTLLADAGSTASFVAPAPKPAVRAGEPLARELRMAVGAPVPSPEEIQPETLPSPIAEPHVTAQLVVAPHLVERAVQFTRPSNADRSKLDQLVRRAVLAAAPQPVSKPKPAAPRPVLASLDLVSLPAVNQSRSPPAAESDRIVSAPETVSAPHAPDEMATGRFNWAVAWAQAPEYDDDHPEELSYRPFPLAPLMTESESADDPALAKLVHPDIAKTLDVIDDEGAVLPMRFRPGRQVAELLWAQEFRGEAVSLSEIEASDPSSPAPHGFAERTVKTTSR
jgi:uncharacterized protein YcbK (DUF882 family)